MLVIQWKVRSFPFSLDHAAIIAWSHFFLFLNVCGKQRITITRGPLIRNRPKTPLMCFKISGVKPERFICSCKPLQSLHCSEFTQMGNARSQLYIGTLCDPTVIGMNVGEGRESITRDRSNVIKTSSSEWNPNEDGGRFYPLYDQDIQVPVTWEMTTAIKARSCLK